MIYDILIFILILIKYILNKHLTLPEAALLFAHYTFFTSQSNKMFANIQNITKCDR